MAANFNFDNVHEALTHSSKFYLLKVDLEGRYQYVNPTFDEKFNFLHNGNMIGGSVRDSVYEEDYPAMYNATANCLQDPDTPVYVRLRKPRPNNSFFWTDWEFKAVKGANNQVEGIQCIGFDVSELIERNESLRKTNQELDTFVYRVSHDLKAPLASSMGLIEVARMEKDLRKRDQFLEYQEISLKKMEKFINDILTYSRNARKDIEVSEVNLKHLIKEICDDLDTSFSLESQFIGPDMIRTDPMRLNAILGNILSNACKYADPNRKLEVKLTAWVEDQTVSVLVEDNGIGIENGQKDKVFEMFYRATSASKGSGLGLYIVKEAIDKLKGTIDMDSEEGVGTKFLFKIPNHKKYETQKNFIIP